MKKALLLLSLFSFLFYLSSCGNITHSPYELMDDFLSIYRGTGTVYSPKCKEGDAGYVTEDICKQFFRDFDLVPLEYAIYSHSRLDGICEVGFLSSVGVADKRDVLELASSRVDFLRGYYNADGGAMIHGGVIIYYFSTDARALEAIKKIT